MANPSTSSILRNQWVNPSDLMSLFLLIGSDVVQQAIAQLVGYRLRLPGMRKYGIPITPVALSFGWVAYAFSNLVNVAGDMKMMPTNYQPSIVVNCVNGFQRGNRSWILNRLLLDHEIKCEAQTRMAIETKGREFKRDSVRIDIFQLGQPSGPELDCIWWTGWAVIILQLAVAIIPWILYGDWGTFLVTLGGNVLVAVTCALPQWEEEKWPKNKVLSRESVFCLTRGNGHPYIMVFIGGPGSWDLEKLATGYSSPRRETRWVSATLAIFWTCLLVSLSGLKDNTLWYMGIGVIGMLHNIVAAGVTRSPGTLNLPMTNYARVATIIGKREVELDNPLVEIDSNQKTRGSESIADYESCDEKITPTNSVATTVVSGELSPLLKEHDLPDWLGPDRTKPTEYYVDDGVHGALMELEKWVPTAGLAMVQMFFPSGLKYNGAAIRERDHKKFWKAAYKSKNIRKAEAEKKRKEEREQKRVPVPLGA
ncbi:hypothetical protein ABKA04_004430 [Annulohypoxylon sp. FPYF3050]